MYFEGRACVGAEAPGTNLVVGVCHGSSSEESRSHSEPRLGTGAFSIKMEIRACRTASTVKPRGVTIC
jgi:hypothetical protein